MSGLGLEGITDSGTKARVQWLAIDPESWRADLLRIVLRAAFGLGLLVCIPSVALALKSGMIGVAVMDTLALAFIFALGRFERVPERLRAIGTSAVFYALGAGLMIGIGAISQIYLFGFSLLTALLLGLRWGVGTVVLNAVTMLAIGYMGFAAPDMVVPRWTPNFAGWSVITANFVMVNVSLVLAIGAVISVLERALRRAVDSREALGHERKELVKLNESLEAEVRERARAESSLLESRALLNIAGRTAQLGGWRLDVKAARVAWSDEVCEIHQIPPGATPTIEEVIAFYVPESRALVREVLARGGSDGTPFDVEAEIVTAEQQRRWVRAIGSALRDAEGTITHVHGSIQDITPQRRAEARQHKLEEQLRQAQKMEAIGSLAGGVAHDFNNLLTVILSLSELIMADLPTNDPIRADLLEMKNAGLRASELTRQLLAFSRKQILQPVVLDLNLVVTDIEKMLRRLLGADIDLSLSISPEAARIHADAGQLEQVIMNLVVNARDAMPMGGSLMIETSHTTLDESYAADHAGVEPGAYVMLAVSDTGTGMDRETQARIFEPFFTTKDKSKGTGLGLSTVYGIVQQSGGHVWVYSEPTRGTTFKVYLPRSERAVDVPAPPVQVSQSLRGKETILLVEDEAPVRNILRTILRKYGYHLLEAQNGGEAFLVCEQFTAAIHLMISDVVMPRMSGRQLAERLAPLRPEMKVLFVSGYTENTIVHHGVLDAGIDFLPKPIMPEALLKKVRQVLDARPPRTKVEDEEKA